MGLEPEIRVLADASLVIQSVRSRDELVSSATRVLTEMLDAEGSSVVLRDQGSGDLVFHLASGRKSSELRSFRLAEGEGITGHCVNTSSSVIANDVRSDSRFSPRADEAVGFRTRSILCAPLVFDGRCIGALTVVNSRRESGFNDRDQVFCEILAGQIALAVRNVEITRRAVEAAHLAAMGQAVAGVAHCMKNLVFVLRGGLQVLKKELDASSGAEMLRGLPMLEHNLGRMSDLLQEMLTYAKQGAPDYGETDLGALIQSVVEAMQPTASERGVHLLAAPGTAGIGLVELDAADIHRCLLNLVSNAIDACEKDAAVRIATDAGEPRWVSIEVTDEGCGMKEDIRRSLFKPFFSTKGARGTGLGLAVTQKIVQEHGGRIEVESEPGKGSTFRIWLPIRRPLSQEG
ncbi:MAG: GAF domain-containing sensor histidine kinase [Proteobacteria bacterium]|nr:GAF domain-containing sensor histidine kinase [Pseudomonadota bacterium]